MNLLAFASPGLSISAETLFQLNFEHLETAIDDDDPSPRAPFGFTLWKAADLRLGWDWIAQNGTVLLLAPLSIVTNASVVGADGHRLTERELNLLLNVVVHKLPWQPVIRKQLDLDGSATPVRIDGKAREQPVEVHWGARASC